ncbi:GNAT family N-acetyltransferase [Spirosoma sp. 209]|uniref:GNAT family N-acetyltransferase n=1 Tax=Spirosoma sp. 209 TaxID=1955701 RepID=UPI00098D53A9|nr:GNAT family N-acetyltransferase [Spirosoma sp. 209]
MITITLAQTDDDLRGILALQQKNLVRHLPADVQANQGFVTLQYSLDQMQQMHAVAPSVVAKDGDQIVGYAITSAPETRAFIPELGSLFDQIDSLTYEGQLLSQYPYYVMGQVCVADTHRGQGIFDRLYEHHRAMYSHRYRMLITDISIRNTRSFRAHERVGFRPVHQFYEPGAGETWIVVVWDWQLPG